TCASARPGTPHPTRRRGCPVRPPQSWFGLRSSVERYDHAVAGKAHDDHVATSDVRVGDQLPKLLAVACLQVVGHGPNDFQPDLDGFVRGPVVEAIAEISH